MRDVDILFIHTDVRVSETRLAAADLIVELTDLLPLDDAERRVGVAYRQPSISSSSGRSLGIWSATCDGRGRSWFYRGLCSRLCGGLWGDRLLDGRANRGEIYFS